MGLAWLKKIADKIQREQNRVLTYPVKKQEACVNHFDEPKDTLERSYFQYCCQMKLYGKMLHWLLNLAALPMSVVLLLNYARKNMEEKKTETECVFICFTLPENVVPDSLRQRYPQMLSLRSTGNRLDHEDITFLRTIFKRYPFSWMFWLKIIIKVSQFSDTIAKYNPKAIVSCDEYSFTSSAITAYCRTKGIKRINVMHGEKLYFMRDSFMEYDEFYVWNQHYVDLFTALGAKKGQYRVEIPESLRIQKCNDISIQYDYTYYLGNENNDTLQTIARAMQSVHRKGKRICVRPHPRYSDLNLVKKLFYFADIEDSKAVTIEQSLLRTNTAVSLYSTVLYQGYNNGITAVIDDVSSPAQFAKLKELQYVMLSLEHRLLSELLEE